MTPKPRRLSAGEKPTPPDDDRWQMWLPNCERPLEHPALSSLPAELHIKPSLELPSVPPRRVIAVISDGFGAQAARTMREKSVSDVIAWSWRLPERAAADLQADGIGVVFGFHTADEVEAAEHCRRGTSDPLTVQLAELEELAGLDREAV